MAEFKRIVEEIQKEKGFDDLKKQGINPIDILEEKRRSIERYSENIALRIAKNAISQKTKKLANTVEMEGIILSPNGVDRRGSKAPYSYPVLFSDGSIKTVTSWDSKVFYEVGKYKFRGSTNETYKNINTDLAIKQEFDVGKIPEFLEKITYTTDSDFSKLEKYETIAVTGVVNWINSIPTWEDGEKVGVENPFDSQKRPVFNIVLEMGVSEKGTKNHITVSLQPTKNGSIFIEHNEIETVLKDVVFDGNIEETIEELTLLLKGVQLTAIGELISLKDSTNENGDAVTYITLRALTIKDLNIPKTEKTKEQIKKQMDELKPNEKKVIRGIDIEPETKEPASIEQKIDVVKQTAIKLTAILGRTPTVDELQKQLTPELNIFAETVLKAINKEKEVN